MGEEKDTGWGACFVINRFRHGNGNCKQPYFVKMCRIPRAGLEIDESVTIQTVCI